MPRQFAQRPALPDLRRRPTRDADELAPAIAPHRLLQLQRTIGNSGVRALLAQQATATPRPAVQRFWGDDEETDSGGGGSWLDQAADTVGGWFGGESDTGGSTPANPENSWAGGSDGSDTHGAQAEPGGGEPAGEDKSWWEQATDEVSSWFEDEPEQEPAEAGGETSWWDQLWSEDDAESGETGDGDVTGEPPREIEAVNASCETDDTVGFGSGKSISLHGLTTSNYDHAKPIPAPFPSSVIVTERKVKVSKTQEQDVFDANGTFDVTFASNPSISLPNMPSDLTPCQEKAVRAFIDGPLDAHEKAHKSAFETNYDGVFTATVSANNIKDTPEMRKRAMENPVMAEDQKRATAANSASKALDPWTQTVPGLDCKEPEKKEDTPAP